MTKRARLVTVLGASILCASAAIGFANAQGGSASDGSVSPKLTGGCAAQGTIAGFGTVDPSASGGVYTVPKSGSASYTGSVPVEGDDRPTSGKVEIALPLGLPPINIKSWSNDKSDENSDSGTVSWDIPSIVPGNVEMEVSGYHQDVGVRCEGRVIVKLDGGGVGSPLGIVAILGTLASLTGLVWSAVPGPGRVWSDSADSDSDGAPMPAAVPAVVLGDRHWTRRWLGKVSFPLFRGDTDTSVAYIIYPKIPPNIPMNMPELPVETGSMVSEPPETDTRVHDGN